MSPAPVSTSGRLVIPILLFGLGLYAMLRWNASCGFTLGENADTAQSGRACGAARSGVAILLPFLAIVPALMRSSQRFYWAVGTTLMLDLIVALGLAPSA